MRKILSIIYLVVLLVGSSYAQSSYPIFVSTTLTPPYSLKLSDYSKFGSQQLVVNIAVNDLNVSNLPVKLHIKLETAGVTIETPLTINTTPIYLDGGAATVLFGDDLKDYFDINNLIFKGYSKETYRRTGQLPEGFYKITVEVLHFQTNRLISNAGTATAWIAIGKPPVLKLPENGVEMGEYKGMPIVFSWYASKLGSPMPASGVQYKFEMWEMRIDGISPYTIAASVPVFYEETTTNTMISVFPSTLLMEPGMKYAWRVTATDMSGMVPFEQDGHSEIRVFTYKSKCGPVTNLNAVQRGRNGSFTWDPSTNNTSFNIELRNPATGWLSASETFNSSADFYDLNYGTTYEMRVQAVCDNDPESVSDFSEWKTLEIPAERAKPDSASCPNCGCSDDLGAGTIENLELKRDLKPGDTLTNRFGTTRFIVQSVESQGNGVYKGHFLFWAELWKLKFVCEYWDLSVNTDNVILNMDYQSVYNPQYLLDVDVAAAFLDSLSSAITDLTIVNSIKDTIRVNETITSVYVNAGDSLIAVTVDANGEVNEVVINPDANNLGQTLITDPNGEEYVVTRDGEVMGVDEYKHTGGNDSKIDDYNKDKEANLSSTQVAFAASPNQKYGFDAYSEVKQKLKSKYPSLQNGYIPAYKSIASYGTDNVEPSTTEKGITFRDEMGIPAIKTGNELTVRGASDGSVTALYAYKALSDTTEQVAGKLNLMSFDEQAKKLYIIPVNGANIPDALTLQGVLNNVYKQAVVRWNVVTIDGGVDVAFEGGHMTHGGSSAIAVYNDDQKSIINKFKENHDFEKDALYLFFVDNVQGKTGDVAGYMPLQRQVGFIYDNPNLFIVAHELGHGTFNLRHTFSPDNLIADKNSTQNLMDYAGGTELWQHQWALIHDPQSLWFAWAQDESEGEGKTKDDRNIIITKTSEFLPSINDLNVDFLVQHGNSGVVTAQVLNANRELVHEEVVGTPIDIKDKIDYLYYWNGKMNKRDDELVSDEKLFVSIIQGSREITHPDLFGKTKDEKEISIDYTKVKWKKSVVSTWSCIKSDDFIQYKRDIGQKVYDIGFNNLNIDIASPYRANPLKYLEDNIVEITFLGNKIFVHKKFAKELAEIEENCSEVNQSNIQIPSSLRIGNTLGASKFSDHCLGLAIDISPSFNPFLERKNDRNKVDVINTVDVLYQIATGSSMIKVTDPSTLSEMSKLFVEKYKKLGNSSKMTGLELSSKYSSIGLFLAETEKYSYQDIDKGAVESDINLVIDNFNSDLISESEFNIQLNNIKKKILSFDMFNSEFNDISFIKESNFNAYNKLTTYILNCKSQVEDILLSHGKPIANVHFPKDNGAIEYIVCFTKIQSLVVDFSNFGNDIKLIMDLGNDRGALVFNNGFFNIDLSLMKYMLQSGKLKWGASYHDYMHFSFDKSDF